MSSRFHPFADARVGTVLRGKYRLDRVIGVGGMAVVYKATHRNHAEFAVKMLHPQLSTREDVRARFVREGYAANTLKHPGAVAVVDDDIAEDGAAFLVMELLDGVPCDRLSCSTAERVPAELASAVAIQLLDVLAAAHEKQIVHRDVKPANLFLTRAGVVKVLDFGIAHVREAVAGPQITATSATLGTPAFMAPEHARGRSREIDGRTDLWAVGATFFAMVSGQLVHQAETPTEFLIAAATRPARSLATAAANVPYPLVRVMDRALAFEKGDRWPNAAAMRDALIAAHRASFGEGDVRRVVASAVEGRVLRDEPLPSLVSPAAETRTSQPGFLRVVTERLSTSAPMARDRRDTLPPRSSRWAAGLGAAAVVAMGAAVWLGAHHARMGVEDASANAPAATVSEAMRSMTARRVEPLSAACAAAGTPLRIAPPRRPPPRRPPPLRPAPRRRCSGASVPRFAEWTPQ